MEDEIVRDPVHRFGTCGDSNTQWFNRYGSLRAVLGLYSGRMRIGQDIPVGGNLVMAQTFLKQFIKVQGNYPVRDFRALGWVHSAQKPWWRDLKLYILKYFDANLRKLELHEAFT